jgi:hypothetical protein
VGDYATGSITERLVRKVKQLTGRVLGRYL